MVMGEESSSPQCSLICLAGETTHEAPWRFPLRHGDIIIQVHIYMLAHISVYNSYCSSMTVAMLKDIVLSIYNYKNLQSANQIAILDPKIS